MESYVKWKKTGWAEKENNIDCFHSYIELNSKTMCMLTYMCECVGHKIEHLPWEEIIGDFKEGGQ